LANIFRAWIFITRLFKSYRCHTGNQLVNFRLSLAATVQANLDQAGETELFQCRLKGIHVWLMVDVAVAKQSGTQSR